MNNEYSYLPLFEDAIAEREKLNEDDLNEKFGISKKLIWKAALGFFKFMKEENLNKFFKEYYSDENGKPSNEYREVLGMSKKRKSYKNS